MTWLTRKSRAAKPVSLHLVESHIHLKSHSQKSNIEILFPHSLDLKVGFILTTSRFILKY